MTISNMLKLYPSQTCSPENVLYILGNGFDLAHQMPTNYEDFHLWLLKNGNESFVRRLESLYPCVKNNIGKWSDLEEALGKVTLKEAVDYDRNFRDCSLRQNDEWKYQCGYNLKNVVDVLPHMLKKWAQSILLDRCLPQFQLCSQAHFLSFNYTRTLESIYGVQEVFHIHETAINQRPLVVGYGDAIFEEDDYISEDKYVNTQIIKNVLSHCRKPVDVILQEPQTLQWLDSLTNVEGVVVYGHSCAMVDEPYFNTIANCIKTNACWDFYVYDDKNNAYIDSFAKAIKKGSQQHHIINQ